MRMVWRWLAAGLLPAFFLRGGMLMGSQSLSSDQVAAISFEQKLGDQLPLDTVFLDESGREVKLRDLFGEKPVILVFGYYECPMLCTLILNGMIEALQDIQWTIGREFDVVNISIDPREKPPLAAAKKRTYLKRYGRKGAAAGWHFLTGSQESITRTADAAGFQFAYDEASNEFAHPSGLVFLTPEGRISGYRFGIAFKASEVLESLRQAGSGKPGSPVQKLILLCFHYNPISGKYGPLIMTGVRVLALATLAGLAWLVWRLARRAPAAGEVPLPERKTGNSEA